MLITLSHHTTNCQSQKSIDRCGSLGSSKPQIYYFKKIRITATIPGLNGEVLHAAGLCNHPFMFHCGLHFLRRTLLIFLSYWILTKMQPTEHAKALQRRKLRKCWPWTSGWNILIVNFKNSGCKSFSDFIKCNGIV